MEALRRELTSLDLHTKCIWEEGSEGKLVTSHFTTQGHDFTSLAMHL